MTDKYAVIGNPISHSKSPQIHAAFAKQTNQDMAYEAILAPLDGFENTIKDLIARGYKGANVTVPFKFEAFRISSQNTLTAIADYTRVVNTLKIENSVIAVGDNTDGLGLIFDLKQNLGVTIKDKKVLLIGAGGAANGVMPSLFLQEPKVLTVVNRTIEKAEQLKKHHQRQWQKSDMNDWKVITANASSTDGVVVGTFDSLQNQIFDIVINATSTGLTDTALPIPNMIFGKNCLAYEMVYGRETPFMAQARAAGAQVSDGLGMLVEQAAQSF